MPGYEALGPLWPPGERYRILLDPNHKYHRLRLQVEYEGEWTDLLRWDHGFDTYGKLRPAQWLPVSEWCAWKRDELELLVRKILGQPYETEVIREFGKSARPGPVWGGRLTAQNLPAVAAKPRPPSRNAG